MSLKLGSLGDDVRRLQEVLNLLVPLQPSLRVDGSFGPNTNSRVMEFQRRSSLVPDGIVGPLTIKALVGRTLMSTVKLAPHRIT
jgi:peptidoglycan hydrolase-like protein with peptidoglycan-binding domain